MLVKAIFTLSPGITTQHKIIGIEEAVLCAHLRIADEKKCERCTLHAMSLCSNFAFLHKNILGYWNKEARDLFNKVLNTQVVLKPWIPLLILPLP